MFRRILMGSAGAMALAGSAFAADLAPPPVYAPPVPIFTWTGIYVGGQIGYAWGKNNFDFADNFGDFNNSSLNASGVIGGAHVGYNLQLNRFVIGLEGDVDGSSQNNSFNGVLPFGTSLAAGGVIATPLGGAFTINQNHSIEGSIRGRAGYTWNRLLLYATGGVAFGGFNGNVSGNFPGGVFGPNATVFLPFGGSASASTTRVGWTVGGGLEYAVTDNWSIRAEYRFTKFGNSTLSVPAFDTPFFGAAGAFFNRTYNENRVQVGFSYKFDTATPAPVVAKY